MKKKSYSKKEKSKNLQFSANTTPQSQPSAEIAAVAQHLTRIHNEFSVKLRTLQQTVEKNQRTTILFSKVPCILSILSIVFSWVNLKSERVKSARVQFSSCNVAVEKFKVSRNSDHCRIIPAKGKRGQNSPYAV